MVHNIFHMSTLQNIPYHILKNHLLLVRKWCVALSCDLAHKVFGSLKFNRLPYQVREVPRKRNTQGNSLKAFYTYKSLSFCSRFQPTHFFLHLRNCNIAPIKAKSKTLLCFAGDKSQNSFLPCGKTFFIRYYCI